MNKTGALWWQVGTAHSCHHWCRWWERGVNGEWGLTTDAAGCIGSKGMVGGRCKQWLPAEASGGFCSGQSKGLPHTTPYT